MNREELLKKIKKYRLDNKKAYFAEAFSRNIGLLTREEQEKLSRATVAIPGMGGVGGLHLVTLVRTGIGCFHISDFDIFEPVNVNRQFGATVPNFGRSKMEVMRNHALEINPFLEIKEFPGGITEETIDAFLDGIQVVIDGLDFFSFETRRLLFTRAQEKGVYVITAGPMGFSSAMLIFSPDEGMTFDEYFNVTEDMPEEDKHLAYALGLSPRPTHIKYMDLSRVDLKTKGGPSLNIACQLCAGMAATEAVRIILNKGRIRPVPYYFQFDPYLQKYRKGRLLMGNRNPIQRIKMRAVKWMLQRNKAQRDMSSEAPVMPEGSGRITEETIRYIMRAGIQAPSGDNVQPWKFSWEGDTINLYLDEKADHSFFNVKQIASIISCGAVVENMCLAAGTLGLRAETTPFPSGKADPLMASLKLTPIDVEPDSLSEYIWTRHTNRKFYEKRSAPGEVLEELTRQVGTISGASIHFLTSKEDLLKTARVIYKVDRIRTEHRPLHEHLMQMIRFTDKEAMEKRDGFPIKNLEAGLAGEVFLRFTRPWWVMNIMNNTGAARLVALHSYQGVVQSSGVAILTADGMETEDFLKGGRALERLWLALTQKGLVMQPMAAVTLFWLRWQLEGENGFLKKHRSLLRSVWEQYRTLFPEVDFSKEGHVMLFRLGYGKEIKYFTYRKNIDSFLVSP